MRLEKIEARFRGVSEAIEKGEVPDADILLGLQTELNQVVECLGQAKSRPCRRLIGSAVITAMRPASLPISMIGRQSGPGLDRGDVRDLKTAAGNTCCTCCREIQNLCRVGPATVRFDGILKAWVGNLAAVDVTLLPEYIEVLALEEAFRDGALAVLVDAVKKVLTQIDDLYRTRRTRPAIRISTALANKVLGKLAEKSTRVALDVSDDMVAAILVGVSKASRKGEIENLGRALGWFLKNMKQGSFTESDRKTYARKRQSWRARLRRVKPRSNACVAAWETARVSVAKDL